MCVGGHRHPWACGTPISITLVPKPLFPGEPTRSECLGSSVIPPQTPCMLRGPHLTPVLGQGPPRERVQGASLAPYPRKPLQDWSRISQPLRRLPWDTSQTPHGLLGVPLEPLRAVPR